MLHDDVVRKRPLSDVMAKAKSKGATGMWLLADVAFALSYSLKAPAVALVPPAASIAKEVLASQAVQAAVAASPGGAGRVQEILAEMSASMSLPTVRFVGWLLAKVNPLNRRLFTAISGLKQLVY